MAARKRKDSLRIVYSILTWFFVLSMPLIAVFGCVQVIAYSHQYYDLMSKISGSGADERSERNYEVVQFLRGSSDTLSDSFDEGEIQHLYDVRDVLHMMLFFFVFLLITNAAVLTFLYRTAKTKRYVMSYLLRKAGFLTLVACAFLLIAAIFFTSSFHIFHVLFFEQGSWLFYEDDLLIQLYPYDFFRYSFLVIIGGSAGAGLLLLLLGRALSKGSKKQPQSS